MTETPKTTEQIIICEPRRDCADQHVLRWHCMRGFDGAPDDVCPLAYCDQQGANRPRQPGRLT